MWHWYGVKTLYRVHATGKPRAPDKYYDERSTLVEERVVVLLARSFDEALRKGESEAKAYAKAYQLDRIGRKPATLRNPYGQPLSARYLGAIDVYEMSEPPDAGVEVFSSTSLISSVMSDRALVDARFGAKEGHRGARTKFLNGQFSGKTWWIPPVRNKRRGKR